MRNTLRIKGLCLHMQYMCKQSPHHRGYLPERQVHRVICTNIKFAGPITSCIPDLGLVCGSNPIGCISAAIGRIRWFSVIFTSQTSHLNSELPLRPPVSIHCISSRDTDCSEDDPRRGGPCNPSLDPLVQGGETKPRVTD